jgi:CelD/BcsL family acetyltransferase involved in cellulose biosynthesis
VVEPVPGIDDLAEEWDRLAARSDNVFATRLWLATWWRHFGRDRPLRLRALRDPDDGGLVAIVPLYVAARAPVRTLRFLGHGPTDQLGPVCAVDDRRRALAALPAALASAGRWDLAIADELPDLAGGPPAGAAVLARTPSHAISFDAGGSAGWFASRSPNLRDQLRRGRRKLAAQGEVTFRLADDPARLERDLDLLFELHERHWSRRPGGSRAYAGREAFHRDVARSFLASGGLRLRFLELDGVPVAALHSFWFDGVESHYQGGRDPAFDACSVGLLIHEHAIRASADAGDREYRFLRGDEPYKVRLANRTDQQVGVAWARGPAGHAAQRAVAQLPRLSRRQARWVPAPWAWGTGGSPRWGRP